MGAGPSIIPGLPSGGLIPDAASELPSEIRDKRNWSNGLSFRLNSCNPPRRWYNSSCITGGVAIPDGATKTIEANPGTATFRPVPIYSLQGCDVADINQTEYQDMARLAVETGLSAEFAKELTAGTFSGNPSFKSVAIPLNTTVTETNIVLAVSKLLKARIQAGTIGRHVLHVPVWMVPQFNDHYLSETRLDNKTYLRGTSTRISFDYYPQFTPDLDTAGAANGGEAPIAGESYLTITGPVEYAYDAFTYNEAQGMVQSRLNQTLSRVETYGIYRFDPCDIYTILVAE